MNHARVKALKGEGKTTSKKAIKSGRASASHTPRTSPIASLLSTPSHTPLHTPAHSTAPSLVDSDSDDDDDSESNSGDDSLVEVDEDGISTFDVKKFLDEIQDRKHNNNETREQLLEVYIKTLRNHYNPHTHEWLDESAQALAEHFLRTANRGLTARERLLSLYALNITLGTTEEVDIYEDYHQAIRQIIIDDDDEDCEIFAIYALCFAVLYGGGDEEIAQELLDYLSQIVQTDGESIEAHGSGPVVSAALQAWSFVASHVEDISDAAWVAMDAFVDQLDSTDMEVQAHAASCIAFIYEGSRNHEEETDEPFNLPYDPHLLAKRMAEITKQTFKGVAKKDRKALRDGLNSAITSLERGVGPGYSTAGFTPDHRGEKPAGKPNEDGVVEFGYRQKLRLGNYVAPIESWGLLARVDMMKLFFGGHLLRHIFDNPVVAECLSDVEFNQNGAPKKHKKKPLTAREAKR